MARVSPLVVLLLLAGSMLGVAPAAPASASASASADLVADAGDSALAYNGAPLALRGAAYGGEAPYAFAWSFGGSTERIVDATSANATFDTVGLDPQDVEILLTVTDADGDVSTDTVRHRVESAPILVRRNVTLNYGVPDEEADLGLDARIVNFLVPAGLTRIVATLDWQNGRDPTGTVTLPYDLDFVMLDPSGVDVSGGQGQTDRKPERIVIDAPVAGAWTARILPYLTGPTTATVTIQGFPAGSMPRAFGNGPYAFGALDPQELLATATGGVEPYSYAWDFDGNGIVDATGAAATASLAVGEHVARVRVTDAAGFEVTATAAISVREADTILRLRCGNVPTTPYWAMEFTSTKGSCWIHGGHHTYFLGDAQFALRRITGYIFTVEQQFSPPTEYVLDPTPTGATPIHLQISMDGLTWSELEHGEYAFASLSTRQRVDLEASGSGEAFRFVRVHEPLSAAQGLSGYLDHSELDVEADLLPAVPAPAVAPATREYDCLLGDHMEDLFATHPCWFGGIDRYDAPSFWHTYPLGDGATLSRVRGELTLLPWRLDDWTQGDAALNATNMSAFVQTSVDGVHWTDVARVPAAFGAPAVFDVPLPDAPARFVRLFPEYHARFDQTGEFAPNHHPKGYFVDSRIFIDGLLPAA